MEKPVWDFPLRRQKKRKSISQTCLAALVWKHRHLKSVQCIAAYLLISILNLINVHPQFKLQFYCKSNKPFDSILAIGDSYEMNHPVEWQFFSFLNPHNAQELCIHIFQFLQTVLPNWKSYILHLHSDFYFYHINSYIYTTNHSYFIELESCGILDSYYWNCITCRMPCLKPWVIGDHVKIYIFQNCTSKWNKPKRDQHSHLFH